VTRRTRKTSEVITKRHKPTATTTMGGATATSSKKKKGLLSRFKKKKDKTETTKEEQPEPVEPTPPPSPEPSQEEPRQTSKSKKSVTSKGIPVVTGDNPDDFNPSDVRKTLGGPKVTSKSLKKEMKKSKKKAPRPNSVVLDKAPTAREAAFSGPPRYDWIDVVRCRFPMMPLHHGGRSSTSYVHIQSCRVYIKFGGYILFMAEY
jgi:hypothetical protein